MMTAQQARLDLEAALRSVIPSEVPLPFGLSRARLETLPHHLREGSYAHGSAAGRATARRVVQEILNSNLPEEYARNPGCIGATAEVMR